MRVFVKVCGVGIITLAYAKTRRSATAHHDLDYRPLLQATYFGALLHTSDFRALLQATYLGALLHTSYLELYSIPLIWSSTLIAGTCPKWACSYARLVGEIPFYYPRICAIEVKRDFGH